MTVKYLDNLLFGYLSACKKPGHPILVETGQFLGEVLDIIGQKHTKITT